MGVFLICPTPIGAYAMTKRRQTALIVSRHFPSQCSPNGGSRWINRGQSYVFLPKNYLFQSSIVRFTR